MVDTTTRGVLMDKIKLKDLVEASEISRGLFGKAPNEGEVEQAEIINSKDFVNGRIDTKNLEKKEWPVC